MITDEYKQRMIVRQSSLKSAVDLIQNYTPAKELGIDKADIAIAIAKKFEKYVFEMEIDITGGKK